MKKGVQYYHTVLHEKQMYDVNRSNISSVCACVTDTYDNVNFLYAYCNLNTGHYNLCSGGI